MEHAYMIVAFVEDFNDGDVTEPPKHVHVTIKKKFKLKSINEKELVGILKDDIKDIGPITLKLGESKVYYDDAFEIIEVYDADFWKGLHDRFVTLLGKKIESRDPHFEGENYLPHVSWRVRNEMMIDPEPYLNIEHKLDHLYLIKRIDPNESIAKIVAKLRLS